MKMRNKGDNVKYDITVSIGYRNIANENRKPNSMTHINTYNLKSEVERNEKWLREDFLATAKQISLEFQEYKEVIMY